MGPVLALLLSAGACGEKDRPPAYNVAAPRIPHERLPPTTAAFVEGPCAIRVEGRATQCGTVTVPEAAGSENRIELAITRVFSDARDPKAEPVFYLEGGPGAGSTDSVDFLYPVFEPVAPDRDFVFFDQRGTGSSNPLLQCYESGAIDEALSACFKRLSDESNLDHYNSVENARDVDEIRQALGYDTINLYGISYGTRLGLTVMRDFPKAVRASVLDAVVPLQADLLAEVGRNGYASFAELVETCERDDDCNEAYPDPLGQLLQIVETLNDEPADVNGYPLSGDTVLVVVFNLLYSPHTLALVPLMIDDIAGGDYALFEQLEPVASSGGIAFGMHLSLHCAEEIPFSSAESFETFDAEVPAILRAGLSGRDYLMWCESWPVAQAAGSENEPVQSELPTLVMAGQFDPITPPHFSEAVFEDLTNAEYILVLGESHGASAGECGSRLARQFFSEPDEPLQDGCLDDQGGLDFQSWGPPRRAARRVSSRLVLQTERPDPEQLQRAIDDLSRRLRQKAFAPSIRFKR